MKFLFKIILACVVVLGISACANTQPIMNIDNAPVASSMTDAKVQAAIIKAANKRGWLIEESKNNEMIASINVRNHQARVRISFSENSYSIKYESSENLKQRNNKIHRNYNRWINNLDNDIRREIANIAFQN